MVVRARGYEAKSIRLKDYMKAEGVIGLGDVEMVASRTDPGGVESDAVPEILFQTVNLNAREYGQILAGLKEAGYRISDRSRNYDQPPASFPKQGTVQYLGEAHAKEAKKLAKLMLKITEQKFEVKQFQQDIRLESSRFRRNQQEYILVQYFPNRRID
jgi:hypothetical protein